MNKTIKPRPLTDKFIHDLKMRMQENQPKITQVRLGEILGKSKQYINCYFRKTRFPCGETILRLQELLKTGFKMFL